VSRARDVRPRPAASLVVADLSDATPRVLLGRRPPRDRFMPDVWVFPGGRVDPRDRAASAASELRPEVAARLRADAGPSLARALAVAAIRETREETGLELGARRAPDLAAVDYLARAITPAGNPIRYHARFFAVDARRLGGTLRASDELLDLDWWPLARALELPLVNVTRVVLEEALRWSRDPASVRDARAPLIHYRRGRILVRRD